MKSKEFGPRGGGARPLRPPKSATDLKLAVNITCGSFFSDTGFDHKQHYGLLESSTNYDTVKIYRYVEYSYLFVLR